MNGDYIIEIKSECCICLDYLNIDIQKLECCNHEIHKKCIYEMFVFQPIVNANITFICPLCRKKKPFHSILTLNDVKKYSNNDDIINKYVVPNKFDEMIVYYIKYFFMFITIFMIILFILIYVNKCV